METKENCEQCKNSVSKRVFGHNYEYFKEDGWFEEPVDDEELNKKYTYLVKKDFIHGGKWHKAIDKKV